MGRRWRKFRALAPRDRSLVLEAAVLLTLASPLVFVVPFRHIARWLGVLNHDTVPDADPAHMRAIGNAVTRVARHLPWRPLCLPQALAARAMLRRRGIPSTFYLGMRLEEGTRNMRAHAWVTAGTIDVIGGQGADQFTVLARYSR